MQIDTSTNNIVETWSTIQTLNVEKRAKQIKPTMSQGLVIMWNKINWASCSLTM